MVDSPAFVVDTDGNVGIGSTPTDYNAAADNLVVGALSGANGITIVAGTADTGNLFFADGTTGTDEYRGYVQYSHGANALIFGTDATERMRIASGGITTLGGTSTAPAFTVVPVASQVNYFYAAGSATGQSVTFGALGSDTNINVSYQTKGTGGFYFGTNAGAATQLRIDHTASANNYLTLTGAAAGGNPVLSTNGTSGANVAAVSLACGRLQFPATQNASADANTLDDYEEGTFTPGITFGGAAVGVTYSAQVGRYTKIGNRVIYQLQLILTSKGSSTGALLLTGLPFTTNAANVTPCAIRLNAVTSGLADVMLYGVALNSVTTIRLDKTAGSSLTQLTDADVTATLNLSVAGEYEV